MQKFCFPSLTECLAGLHLPLTRFTTFVEETNFAILFYRKYISEDLNFNAHKTKTHWKNTEILSE